MQKSESKQRVETCATLTMFDFIQIVCGEVAEPPYWETLYNEYNELSGSSGENKQLELAKIIEYITTRIKIVQAIVERLWVRRNDEAIELLQEMGFYLPFEDLHGDLERVILMLKGEQIELNRAVADYEELVKEGEQRGDKPTVLNWYSILAMLGKHNACVLNPRTLSVLEYISFDLQFRQWVEINKPKEVMA